MKRPDGFYWVRYDGKWEVARWVNDGGGWPEGWYFATCEMDFDDSHMDEIGPKVEPP